MALVAGAAFGASATRVEVRDAESGALVATGTTRHQDLGPEVDDPTAWWRSLAGALGQTGEREIAAISVCGSHPGLVLLDGAGAVLRPLQRWVDGDSAADAARLRKALGAQRWAARAGALPHPATAVSRLAWLRRTDPAAFERIGAALLPHDWLTYRLAGRAVTDRGSASLTGVWSPAVEGWLGEVLDLLAPGGSAPVWEERLPRVLAPAERADWLDAPVYELLGLRGRPLVGPGTGEPMAVALALDLRPGRIAVVLGESTTVLAGLDAPVADPSGAVCSRADATGRHLAVATAAGGATLIQVVQHLLGLDAGELGTMAGPLGAAAEGLVLVPGVEGRHGAVLAGLSVGVQRADVARAAFDGVACAALDAVDLLVDAGATWDDEEPLLLSAPAPDLPTHARVLAELAGRPVRPAPAPSLAAAGACVQAAAVLHGTAPEEVSAAWRLAGGEWVEPADDPTRMARRIAHTTERARQRRALLDRE